MKINIRNLGTKHFNSNGDEIEVPKEIAFNLNQSGYELVRFFTGLHFSRIREIVQQLADYAYKTGSSSTGEKTSSFAKNHLPKAPVNTDVIDLLDELIQDLSRYAEYLMKSGIIPPRDIKAVVRNSTNGEIRSLRNYHSETCIKSFAESLSGVLGNLGAVSEFVSNDDHGRGLLAALWETGERATSILPEEKHWVSDEQAVKIMGISWRTFYRYEKEFPRLTKHDDWGVLVDLRLLEKIKREKDSKRFSKK